MAEQLTHWTEAALAVCLLKVKVQLHFVFERNRKSKTPTTKYYFLKGFSVCSVRITLDLLLFVFCVTPAGGVLH